MNYRYFGSVLRQSYIWR